VHGVTIPPRLLQSPSCGESVFQQCYVLNSNYVGQLLRVEFHQSKYATFESKYFGIRFFPEISAVCITIFLHKVAPPPQDGDVILCCVMLRHPCINASWSAAVRAEFPTACPELLHLGFLWSSDASSFCKGARRTSLASDMGARSVRAS